MALLLRQLLRSFEGSVRLKDFKPTFCIPVPLSTGGHSHGESGAGPAPLSQGSAIVTMEGTPGACVFRCEAFHGKTRVNRQREVQALLRRCLVMAESGPSSESVPQESLKI